MAGAESTESIVRLSLAQLGESLWADARQRVYALVIGSKVPGLRERLAQADVDDWDGLWTGELDVDEKLAAPVLITLRRESAFTRWLLESASSEFPDWGALALARGSFLAMRAHCRALCKAQLANGQSIRIDWMDPEVMETLLPVAATPQLERAFSGLDMLITLSATRWVRWSVQLGRLTRQSSGVLA